jgi:putative PIN family toxin of toxin-antitoxin system
VRRAVLDPNVLVSAYISPHGPPARLLELAFGGQLRLVVSARLMAVLAEVLRHGRGLERYRDFARVEAFIAAVQAKGEMHADPPDPAAASRDASDDYLVALARMAEVSLVSATRTSRCRPSRMRRGNFSKVSWPKTRTRSPPNPSPVGGGTTDGMRPLERPDSLRPFELLIPSDSQASLPRGGRVRGGNLGSPRVFIPLRSRRS